MEPDIIKRKIREYLVKLGRNEVTIPKKYVKQYVNFIEGSSK
jgi:hypothetical protein